MSECSEFLTLPIFDLRNWEAEGQWQRGRLSLLTFFGEAKKVSGRRATPGQRRLNLRDRFDDTQRGFRLLYRAKTVNFRIADG